MKTWKFVILGGGMVAGYAAKKMVELGLKADELLIVSADTALPYERPPLSKGLLAGKETEASILISPAKFYADHGIAVRLGCEVQGLDPTRNVLHLGSGEEVGFDQLLVATGARARRLEIPGAGLAGVHYLRSLADAKHIAEHAAHAKNAVVIGGGFIAMEVASVLAQKGIATTMVVQDDRVWKRFFTPAMSRFFEGYYEARGVHFAKQSEVAEIQSGHAATAVRLKGGQSLSCDLVVAGIGAVPVLEPVANRGLQIEDGVVVNEFLETTRAGIYAAGDIANYPDALFGKRRRVEHWDNAVAQGQHCGAQLLGQRTAFEHLPYFFSDVFDLSYEFWGDAAGANEVIERGDLATSSFSVWWLSQGRLVAAFTMNRPDAEREAAQHWIQSRKHVAAETLQGAAELRA